MAEKSKVFADSNFFVALFSRTDSLYERARKIADRIKRNQTVLVISNLIFLEVVTVVSQRGDREQAIRAGRYFFEDDFVEICYIDPYLHQKAWKIFKSIPYKDISFVDCSIVAAMNAEGISVLLTFDDDFKRLKKYHKFKIYA